MTWTAAEALVILTEGWDDATSVGGFHNSHDRAETLSELQELFGNDLQGFTLIGYTGWSDYEEGGATYLFLKDGNLWQFARGSSVMGDYGESFLEEVELTSIEVWLEEVNSNIHHAENFTAY